MEHNNHIIVADNVTAGYPGHVVWQNTQFSIERGEFVGILGPNGSGKTTLFRLLLGLAKPLGGVLSVFDSPPARGNTRIGYVPQRHPIDSEMGISAVELVRLGLTGNRWGIGSAGQGLEEAYAALHTVGAKSLTHRPLGSLSGGELQRIFLAEALIGKPELLLLDEPLANLDIRREANFIQLINEVVRSQNVAALLIAHNINPLLPVLDRVMYIANGRLTTGTPQDVLTSESLSELYGTPVEVLRDSLGRIAIIGTEEPAHHHE